LMTYISVA